MLNYRLVTKNPDMFATNLATLEEVKSWYADKSVVGIDTENSGLDPHTGIEYCFQIGDSNIQYIIDMLTYTYKDIEFIFENESVLILGQNLKYDLQWLYKHGIIVKNKLWDTYIAELRLTNGVKFARKNLQALEEKYLGTDFIDKSARKDIHTIPKIGYTEHTLKYSAGDVYVLPELYEKQLEAATEDEQVRIIEMDCEYVKVLAYSEFSGIYLDPKKWSEQARITLSDYLTTEKKLNNWIIDSVKEHPIFNKYLDTQLSLFEDVGSTVTINWNSSKQLIPLFEYLGVNCMMEVKGKMKKSTEAKLLKSQKNVTSLLPIYLHYASLAKEVSTYGMEFLEYINEKTGRVHPSYLQVLASGRLASGGDEQSKKARTANIMVIPRGFKYRGCFTAQNPKENTLINYDYSQMEDVVFANQCKEPQLITLLKDGLDGHSYTAKIAFKEELKNVALEDVAKVRPDLRQKAKAVKFTVNFGGSGFTIANNLGLPMKEGEEIYNNYIDGFPKMKEYFEKVEEDAIKRGYILIDPITGAKYQIDAFSRFKKLHEKYSFDNKNFWAEYKVEKKAKSPKFYKIKEEMSYYFRWKGAIRRHALNLPTQGEHSALEKSRELLGYPLLKDAQRIISSQAA